MEKYLNEDCIFEIYKYINTLDLINFAIATDEGWTIVEKRLQTVSIHLNDGGADYTVQFNGDNFLTMTAHQTMRVFARFGHLIETLALSYIYAGAHEFINQCYNLHTLTLDHVTAQRSLLPIINRIETLNVFWCSGIFTGRYRLIQCANIANIKHITFTKVFNIQQSGLESITVHSLTNNDESCIVQLILTNSKTIKSIKVHTNDNYLEHVKTVITNVVKTFAKVYVYDDLNADKHARASADDDDDDGCSTFLILCTRSL